MKGLYYFGKIAIAVWPIWAYLIIAFYVASYFPAQYGALVTHATPIAFLLVMLIFAKVDEARRPIAIVAAGLCFYEAYNVLSMFFGWFFNEMANQPKGNLLETLRSANYIYSFLGPLDIIAFFLGLANFVFAGAATVTLVPSIIPALSLNRKRKQSSSDLFGDARWMPRLKMRKLSKKGGIVLGQMDKPHETKKTKSPLMKFPLQAHGLTCAPSRSGKGLVIATNLLAPDENCWQGPVVVIDPKGEAYAIAARRRRELGRRVVLLDPFGVVKERSEDRPELQMSGVESWRYNPLDFVRSDERMVGDINVILDALVMPPKGNASQNESHFADGARRVIASSIAWVMVKEPKHKRTLMRVYDLINQEWGKLRSQLEMMAASDAGYGLAADGAKLLLSVGEKERGSFLSTVTNALSFLQFPQMKRHLEKSDFGLDPLCTNDMDLFIVVPDDLLDKVRMYLRLWVTLPMAQISRKTPSERVLLILDEMPAIGRLAPVLKAYRMAAGKGLSVWGFTQTFAGLIEEYGKEAMEDIRDNADFVQFFEIPPSAKQFSEEVSDLIGKATFTNKNQTKGSGSSAQSGKLTGSSSANRSSSESLIGRPLMTPEDLRNMDYRKQIILARTREVEKAPMHLWQPRYFLRDDCNQHADPNPYII